MSAPKQTNQLIGQPVTVNADATTLKGMPLPQAGKAGVITGKTPSGKQYQVTVGDTIINLPLDAFTLVLGQGLQHPGHPYTLPLTAITRSRTNPRQHFDPTELQDLAESIKRQGLAQPILVRKLPGDRLQDTFESEETRHATHEIVAGERRWRASKIAGLRDVPVYVRELTDTEALELQLLENMLRANLGPLEEAMGFQRLVDEHAYTPETLAEAMHKSRSYMYESLRLPQLCDEAKAAMRTGTLLRSVALLVAQRPTTALQVEFTKRVLTSGPEGTPLSYRSARELAQRNYQTDLAQAPFQLTDADLLPKAGACNLCPKRTGATAELWDKSHADVCTDTRCFADKKEAHYDRLKFEAGKRGQKVITGREAREIMPTEGKAPTGYLLLDKPSKVGDSPMRTMLGQDVPRDKVVLIESPSGAMVETIPVRDAGKALEAKAKAAKPTKSTEPTREDLEADYATRWRAAALEGVIGAVEQGCKVHSLPPAIAYRVLTSLTRNTTDKWISRIFGLNANYLDEELADAIEAIAKDTPEAQYAAMLMLVACEDFAPAPGRPLDECLYLMAAADETTIKVAELQAQVQEEMKAEAADRAATTPTPAPAPANAKGGKSSAKPKTTKADATAAIAAAMQEADDALAAADAIDGVAQDPTE